MESKSDLNKTATHHQINNQELQSVSKHKNMKTK